MIKQGPQLDAFQSAGAAPRLLRGAITYVAGTTGAIGTTTLFTVTGDIALAFLAAKCTTDLTSGGVATWTLGVTGNTIRLAGGSTMGDVTGWNAGAWADGGGPSYVVGGNPDLVCGASGAGGNAFAINGDIIQTIAGATITGGVVRWYLQYIPLSGDGAVSLHANLSSF